MPFVRLRARTMPRLRALALLIAFGGPLLGSRGAVEGCELCDGPGSSFVSLQNHVETWPLVVLAEPVAAETPGDSAFRITEILKGTGLRVGARVTPPGKRAVMPGQLWLLLGIQPDFQVGSVLMLRPGTRAFLRAIPKLAGPEKPAERLQDLVPWLRDPDPMVAASARKAFAEAPYEAVKAAARRVQPDDLVPVLADPGRAASSRGTLLLLFGLRAGPAERKRLAVWMRDPAMQRARGYAALLAAWLMTTGVDGLAPIHRLFTDPKVDRRAIGEALVKALGFHARNEQDLPRAQILAELVRLLGDPALFPAIVTQLRGLEAWDELGPIQAAFERMGAADPESRTALLGYLRAHPGEAAAALRGRLETAERRR